MEEGLLELLSEAIGFVKMAAPEVWVLAQRQMIVYGIQYVLWALMWLSFGIAGLKFTQYCYRKYQEDTRQNDGWGFTALMVGIFAAFTIIGVIYCLAEVTGYLINPGYYAIKTLLDLAK